MEGSKGQAAEMAVVLSSVSRQTEYVVGGGSVDLIPGTERLRRIACSAAVREEMHHSILI